MDPFAPFKAAQREAWASFLPVESATTIPAARLVKLARVTPGERVLDVACGTGVVAVTAARVGAQVCGLDLSPVLLERARKNASVAGHEIAFTEGDAEALPYPDASFDVVVSQFGHMFAPRPAVVLAEMLRVLKVGGRIAFSTWPPELFMGGVLALVAATCRRRRRARRCPCRRCRGATRASFASGSPPPYATCCSSATR
jgi:SAM-dependent methyltransferase